MPCRKITALIAVFSITAFLGACSQQPASTKKLPPVKFYGTLGYFKDLSTMDRISRAVFSIQPVGTGFIINPEGYALSVYHVVGKKREVNIVLNGGRQVKAQVVAVYPEIDTALLKIPGEGHDYLPLAHLDNVSIMGEVYVIGYPKNLRSLYLVSRGRILGATRLEKKSALFLQSDIAVSAGHSGSPLINSRAQVLGIVSNQYRFMGVDGSYAVSIYDVIKELNLID